MKTIDMTHGNPLRLLIRLLFPCSFYLCAWEQQSVWVSQYPNISAPVIRKTHLLPLQTTPASIMGDALYIYMGGLIAVAAYHTPFSMLRALGDSKTSLIFLVISSLLNIVLDLFFCDCSAYGCCGCSFCHSFVGSDCCCFVYHIFFPQSRTVQTGHSEPIGKYKYDPKVLQSYNDSFCWHVGHLADYRIDLDNYRCLCILQIQKRNMEIKIIDSRRCVT